MKIDFVWKLFPIIYIEKKEGKCKTANPFFFISCVQDLNDDLQIEHEKVAVKHNYLMAFVFATVILLSYFVNFYLMLFMLALYSIIIWVFYFTDVGEYRRDVLSYRKTAKMFAKKHDVALDVAYRHYAIVMMNSGKYDNYANFLGEEKILEDLKSYKCPVRSDNG